MGLIYHKTLCWMTPIKQFHKQIYVGWQSWITNQSGPKQFSKRTKNDITVTYNVLFVIALILNQFITITNKVQLIVFCVDNNTQFAEFPSILVCVSIWCLIISSSKFDTFMAMLKFEIQTKDNEALHLLAYVENDVTIPTKGDIW